MRVHHILPAWRQIQILVIYCPYWIRAVLGRAMAAAEGIGLVYHDVDEAGERGFAHLVVVYLSPHGFHKV
jgi:hypothetical protein